MHLFVGSQAALPALALQQGLKRASDYGFLPWTQVLSEPGVNKRELRARAKAVRKLGQAFYDVNRAPTQRGSATAVMEELASVMQVSHICTQCCGAAPTALREVLDSSKWSSLHTKHTCSAM